MNLGPIATLLDILPCNDTVVSIRTSHILRDDRNRVDTRRPGILCYGVAQ